MTSLFFLTYLGHVFGHVLLLIQSRELYFGPDYWYGAIRDQPRDLVGYQGSLLRVILHDPD